MIETNGNRKPKNVHDDGLIATMRGLYITINILGLWPRKNSQIWYNLIWYIHSIGFFFQIFGPTAGMIVQRHNTKKILDNLAIVIPSGCIYAKWITFIMNRQKFETILCFMENDWMNLKSNTLINKNVPNSKQIMATYARFSRIFFATYLAIMCAAVSNFAYDSFVKRYSDKNITDFDKVLPIPNSWYPLDYNRSSNVQVLALTQTITSITLALANAALDSSFVVMTLHLCGQFKILRYFIEGITYDSSEPEFCKTNVRLMVKRHQLLLKVAESIQQLYDFIIFEHLATCVLASCFLGYKIIAEMESSDRNITPLLQAITCCGAVFESLFSYCLVGDWLSNQSVTIAMGFYNTEWYTFERSINLSFLIIMIRARKPVEITAAKILPMSLKNFTILMKASASYLSVLRAMGVTEN